MRWLADECVHATIVAELRKAGHDVLFAAEESQGADDRALAELVARENRILLTEDKDFGDIVFLLGGPIIPVVLLRIDPKRRELKWVRLAACIDEFGARLSDNFVVVDEIRIRARSLRTWQR